MINECTTDTEGPSKLESVIATLSTERKQLHEKSKDYQYNQLTALQEMAVQMKEQSNILKKVESKTRILETQVEALAERINKCDGGENCTTGSANENLEEIHNDTEIIIETCTCGEIDIEEDEGEAERENGIDVMVKRNLSESDSKRKAERHRKIKVESSLMYHDHIIKESLGLDSADADRAVRMLTSYRALKFTKFMLIKHPDVVQTIRRLRKYVGNTKNWQFTDDQIQEFNKKVATIRKLAECIYKNFQSLFVVPEGTDFWDIFDEEVRRLKQNVCNLTPEELIFYVVDEDRS